MFYYLTVSYDSHDMSMDDDSELSGPFNTPEAREAALKKNLRKWDLESDKTVHVSMLELHQGGNLLSPEVGLRLTRSFVASEEDYPPTVKDGDD